MTEIQIKSTESTDGTLLLLKVEGSLDVFTFWKFKQYLEGQVALAGKNRAVLVDLSGVVYINSSGWTVLLTRRRSLKRMGGDMVLFGMRPEVRKVYDTMNIQAVLPAVESLDEAAGLLKKAESSHSVQSAPQEHDIAV